MILDGLDRFHTISPLRLNNNPIISFSHQAQGAVSLAKKVRDDYPLVAKTTPADCASELPGNRQAGYPWTMMAIDLEETA
jgi:hypothetical protein